MNLAGRSVLFLDDEGSASAWWKPLSDAFEKWKGRITVNTELPEADALKQYDLILLDLVHSQDPDKGIAFLDAIRKGKTVKDLVLPVIVLTAADSAYYCRKALVHGANDYFLKEPLPGMSDKGFFEAFRSLIVRWIGDQSNITLQRQLWGGIQELRNKDFGLPSDPRHDLRYKRLKAALGFNEKAAQETVLNLLRWMVQFPLQESLFHYLLLTSPERFVDKWKVHALASTKPHVEVSLSLGQLVECLLRFLHWSRGGQPPKLDTGYLIDALEYPQKLKCLARDLWDIRTDAKAQVSLLLRVESLLSDGLELASEFALDLPQPPKLLLEAMNSFLKHSEAVGTIVGCDTRKVFVDFEHEGMTLTGFILKRYLQASLSRGTSISVKYLTHGTNPSTGAPWMELVLPSVKTPRAGTERSKMRQPEREVQGGQGKIEGPYSGVLMKFELQGNGEVEGLLQTKNKQKYPVTKASFGGEDPFTFTRGDEVQFYTRLIPGDMRVVASIKKCKKNPS